MNTQPRSARPYLNAVLTANALLLGALVLQGAGFSFASVSHAEQGPPNSNEADEGGRISAAEQRKTMIAELRTLSSRMERVEALLARGVPVRVTELPPGFGQGRADEKTEKRTEKK